MIETMLEAILYLLYAVLLFVFVVGVRQLHFALKHFQIKTSLKTADHSLPSVTVCIPARNETHAMTESLQRVVASTYPKLEVIVLDDSSHDNTPVLIKAFAHEGVRFVEGSPLPDGWLGKNHALQELLKQASGHYVLFLDVDTHLAPDTITQLVNYAQQEDALMVSVLPRREDGLRMSVLFSTLRYFWEIMFHRKALPAVASAAWVIDRKTLQEKWQGFSEFKSAVQPEARIAADLAVTDQYRFVIGSENLGVAYEKKWRSQVATSTRLLFPLLGSNVAHAIIAILDLLIVASPLFIITGGFIAGWGMQQVFAGSFILLFAALFAVYFHRVRKHGWLVGALVWPYIVLQEAVVIGISAYRYTKNAVTWKGRAVRIK